MNKKQGWKIFYESPRINRYWENEKEKSGLLLATCSSCGKKQIRENYQSFWKKFYTLIQDYAITAIAQCECGQWYRYYS